MAKTELTKLIDRFEESAAYVEELTSNLSSFGEILKTVKEHVQPLSDAKVFLSDSNILSELDDLSNNTLEISNKIQKRISTIDGYVDNVKDLSNNYSTNVTDLLSGLQQVIEKTDKFNEDVAPIASKIEEQLARLARVDPKSAAKLVSQQLSEYSDQVIKNYNHVSSSIDSLNEKNKSHQVAMMMNYKKYLEQISSNYESILDKQQGVSEKISEVLQLHISLNNTLSLIEQSNVEPLDHFNMLCDQWAKENIYKASLRKKGLIYRIMIRLAVAGSILLNIELYFGSPISRFILAIGR